MADWCDLVRINWSCQREPWIISDFSSNVPLGPSVRNALNHRALLKAWTNSGTCSERTDRVGNFLMSVAR